jgi:hypothetical protein
MINNWSVSWFIKFVLHFEVARHSLDSFDTLWSHVISVLEFDQMATSDCDIVRQAFPSVTFLSNCCTRNGVSCDSQNRITRLYVSYLILTLQCLVIPSSCHLPLSDTNCASWMNVILFCNNLFLIHQHIGHLLHSSFILILGGFIITKWLVPFHLSWDSSRISNPCKSFCHYLLSPATAWYYLTIINECHSLESFATICFSCINTLFIFFILHSSWF